MTRDAQADPVSIQCLDGGQPLATLTVEERDICARPEAQHATEVGHRLAAEINARPFEQPFRHEYPGYAHVRVRENLAKDI